MLQYAFDLISIAFIFILGCVGEILTEKSGHLNLGIPGVMCIGAAGGILGVVVAGNVNLILTIIVATLFAVIFAAIAGGIYALLTVSLHCNQNVTGLALTIFGSGFSSFFVNNIIKIQGPEGKGEMIAAAGKYFVAHLPYPEKGAEICALFLGHGVLAYVALAIAIAAAIMLRHSRIGLNLRSVGESPATADAAGINVTAYKFTFILIGSAIAGIGGMFYPMQYMAGIIGSELFPTIEGIGWLCIALVIFCLWRPSLAIVGSMIFGALYVMKDYAAKIFPGAVFSFPQLKAIALVPYIVTIIVLIVTSMFGKKETLGPAGLGVSYFREDR
ncbi:MAG: ABC transporter permease [Bacilli bacterium]|nr:ABC transporter permease [Bacilli bacterium]